MLSTHGDNVVAEETSKIPSVYCETFKTPSVHEKASKTPSVQEETSTTSIVQGDTSKRKTAKKKKKKKQTKKKKNQTEVQMSFEMMESAEKTLYHILKEAGGKVKIRADLVKALKNKRFEPNVVTNVLGERLDRKLAPAGGERFIRLNKSKKAIKI